MEGLPYEKTVAEYYFDLNGHYVDVYCIYTGSASKCDFYRHSG